MQSPEGLEDTFLSQFSDFANPAPKHKTQYTNVVVFEQNKKISK